MLSPTAARRRRRRHTPMGCPAQNPAPRAPQPKDTSRPCPPRQAAPNNRSNAAKPAALKPAQRPARPNNANQARPVAPQLNGQPPRGQQKPQPAPQPPRRRPPQEPVAQPPQRNAARRAPAAPAPEPPRPPRRAPQPAPRSRVNRELREEDPGLEMISRRPPKQKFANFEEYMAAHGGATAPIAGEGPAAQSWCQSSTCCPFRRKIWFRRRMTNDPAGGSGPALPGVRRRIDAAGNLAALPPGPQL